MLFQYFNSLVGKKTGSIKKLSLLTFTEGVWFWFREDYKLVGVCLLKMFFGVSNLKMSQITTEI